MNDSEVQPVVAVDMPDAPGWWAFEGHMYWSPSKELKALVYVSDIGGGELSASIMEQDNYSHKILSHEYRYPSVFVGKWFKLELPWEQQPPATQAMEGKVMEALRRTVNSKVWSGWLTDQEIDDLAALHAWIDQQKEATTHAE